MSVGLWRNRVHLCSVPVEARRPVQATHGSADLDAWPSASSEDFLGIFQSLQEFQKEMIGVIMVCWFSDLCTVAIGSFQSESFDGSQDETTKVARPVAS